MILAHGSGVTMCNWSNHIYLPVFLLSSRSSFSKTEPISRSRKCRPPSAGPRTRYWLTLPNHGLGCEWYVFEFSIDSSQRLRSLTGVCSRAARSTNLHSMSTRSLHPHPVPPHLYLSSARLFLRFTLDVFPRPRRPSPPLLRNTLTMWN